MATDADHCRYRSPKSDSTVAPKGLWKRAPGTARRQCIHSLLSGSLQELHAVDVDQGAELEAITSGVVNDDLAAAKHDALRVTHFVDLAVGEMDRKGLERMAANQLANRFSVHFSSSQNHVDARICSLLS